MSGWAKGEEAAFRANPHRWSFCEGQMVEEIDYLRDLLRRARAGMATVNGGKTTALALTIDEALAKAPVKP